MDDHAQLQRANDVALDLSRLIGEPSGGDTRYSVALAGAINPEWVEAYRGLQAEGLAPRRYELDAARGAFRFTCRAVDGTGAVFEALERIEELVVQVNRIAALRRATAPRIRVARPALRAQ
jgi:hypothetical protein